MRALTTPIKPYVTNIKLTGLINDNADEQLNAAGEVYIKLKNPTMTFALYFSLHMTRQAACRERVLAQCRANIDQYENPERYIKKRRSSDD